MASASIVSGSSGTSSQPRGYAIRPSGRDVPHGSNRDITQGSNRDVTQGSNRDVTQVPEAEKPGPTMAPFYDDEDPKITFSCSNSSTWLKLSSFLLVFSFVLQTIAVGAPYWSAGWRRDKMAWHEGVWMTCYRTDMDNKWICGAYDYRNEKPGVPSWYSFCQSMGLISLVVFLPTLLINFFYTMHPKARMFRGLRTFSYVLTFVTGLLPLLMMIVWISGHPKRQRFPIDYKDRDYDDSPFEVHVCFIFEIFAFIVSFAAFGLQIFDTRKNDYGTPIGY